MGSNVIEIFKDYLPSAGLSPGELIPLDSLDIVLPPGQKRIGSFSAKAAMNEAWLIDLRWAGSLELLSRQCWVDFQPSEQALLEKLPWRNPKQDLLILYIVPDVSTVVVAPEVPGYFLLSSCYKRVRRAYLPDTGACIKDRSDPVPSHLTTTRPAAQPAGDARSSLALGPSG